MNKTLRDCQEFDRIQSEENSCALCVQIRAGSREPDNGTLDALNNIININN